MQGKKDRGAPAYQQVALDIAERIASGEICEGQRFSGRSLMSSKYSVSPETIRRALGLLSEMEVVTMQPSVGGVVKSRERAAQFVDRQGEATGMRRLREEIAKLTAERRALDERIDLAIRKLTDVAERFRRNDILQTYEFTVPVDARIDGLTIAETAFRAKTGATILAIRRGEDVSLSPPPAEMLRAGDTLVVVCGVLLVPVVSEFVNQM